MHWNHAGGPNVTNPVLHSLMHDHANSKLICRSPSLAKIVIYNSIFYSHFRVSEHDKNVLNRIWLLEACEWLICRAIIFRFNTVNGYLLLVFKLFKKYLQCYMDVISVCHCAWYNYHLFKNLSNYSQNSITALKGPF
jgi:hypothetical protein